MPQIPRVPAPVGNFGSFPPGGEGRFPSAGDIDIWWREPDAAEVFSLPDRRRTAFHIFGVDKGTTVWRSAPVVVGSREDVFGVPIGPAGTTITVSSSDIRLSPQVTFEARAGDGARRKIYAELHSLQMKGDGFEILAGEPFIAHLRNDLGLDDAQIAKVFRRSYGEVTSWDLNGDRARDLPADNHFNVFFAVKFDAKDGLPAVTVFNTEPLVVVDLGITGMPPLNRVTIPQFPYDLPTMNFVKDPRNPLDGLGAVVAGKGGCCAHSVNIQDDLDFRPVNFGEISGDLRIGDGMELRTGRRLIAGEGYERSFLSNRTTFRKVENQYVDSVFVPNGVTQIAATGLTFRFEDTSAGGVSEAVRNGVSVFGKGGEPAPIHVEAPTDAQAYQPPQSFGIGLGPNAGITFDIAMLRERNPDFYLVNLIALEGMSRESARGASVQLRVLVDGVEIPFATNRFDVPGQSAPISVDLQTAERYVTLVSTSVSGPPGNGVFGLFQFRGFGKLANETLLPYTGPARPNLA